MASAPTNTVRDVSIVLRVCGESISNIAEGGQIHIGRHGIEGCVTPKIAIRGSVPLRRFSEIIKLSFKTAV